MLLHSQSLSTPSPEQARDALRKSQAVEEALKDELHARRNHAVKKHNVGHIATLGDAETGSVPDQREAADRSRTLNDAEGKPVCGDVEYHLWGH